MSYGPEPRLQLVWDWRAAGNFIGGGAGSGLVVFAALAQALGGDARVAYFIGTALVGFGLFCVWLEIGRPLRALHVFFHPKRSWMSREAFVATLLLPCGLAAALGVPGIGFVAGLLGLCYMVCQGRILKAARGIPAWREPRIVPLIVATALAEGGGLLLLAAPLLGISRWLVVLAGLAVILRWSLWRRYRQAVERGVAAPALAALDAAAVTLQWLGTLAPLVLLVVAMALALRADTGSSDPAALAVAALAGAGAVFGGAWFKFVLITRAAFNQGFALNRLPVRGVRRTP